MPRKATNYSKTSVYMIKCKNLNIKDLYIGHTSNFYNRKYVHKHDCNDENKNHLKLYKTINENGGWDNWIMVELELCNCINSIEARKKEHYYCEIYQPTLNDYTPIFIPYDNTDINIDNIVDPKIRNTTQTKIIRNKEREELLFLRKQNKQLNEIIIKHNLQNELINY